MTLNSTKNHVLVLESRERKNKGQKAWGGSENPSPLKSVGNDKSRWNIPLIFWAEYPIAS